MLDLNKIYNMDCLEGMKEIPNGSIDLIVTDPPYLHDNGNWMLSGVMGERSILGKKGGIFDPEGEIYTEMSEFGIKEVDSFLSLAVDKMKIPNMYIFCNETQVPIYGMWAREHNLHFSILVWEKPLSIINKNRFSTNAEYVCRIYDFGTALNKLEDVNEYYNKVIHCPTLRGEAKIHPTQKPVELIARFILLSSKEGDTVLDPFMGSGTTAEACKIYNRNYIGFEKNEKFYTKACRRLESTQLRLF